MDPKGSISRFCERFLCECLRADWPAYALKTRIGFGFRVQGLGFRV